MAQHKCNNCGQFFFFRISDWVLILGGTFTFLGLIFGLLFIPFMIVMLAGLVVIVGSLFYRSSKKDKYQCTHCKKLFTVAEYKSLPQT